MISLENAGYVARDGSRLLDGASLRVREGKLTAVMGLNGAGKTTLLRILSGALSPSSGRVLLMDKELSSYDSRERARLVAFVPQDFPTDFPFTAAEFVLMGRFARQRGLLPSLPDLRLAREALCRAELENLAERRVNTLSGGEKQRLLFARALVQETPLVLLDEPLNHLDVKGRAFALALLRDEFAARGKTVVAVMHDLRTVEKHFTDAVLLKKGRLVFSGPVRDAFNKERLEEVFEVAFAPDGEALLPHA